MTLPQHPPFLFLPEVDSTNTYVAKHLEELPDGMLVIAGRQTAGRGRRGRVWLSPDAVNIYATLVVKTPGKPFLSGAVVGLAGLRLAQELAPDAHSFLKWPNDIYLGTRKLAGILCEGAGFRDGRLTGIAAGIGINVNLEQAVLDSLDRPATSLAAAAGRTWDMAEVRTRFAELVAEVYELYRQDQAALFLWWKRENRLIGCDLEFDAADGTTFAGHFTDITDGGEMVLAFADGTRRVFNCGDVRIRRESLPDFSA